MASSPLQRIHSVIITLILLLFTNSLLCGAREEIRLRGAGASFPEDVYKSWTVTYAASRSQFVNLRMSYDALGSGAGKNRIQQPAADLDIEYAATDSLLNEDEYTAFPGLEMLPTMAGAVVIVYNLPGVNSLTLSRDLIVDIYNGTVTMWNDSAITLLNPNETLPREYIRPFARRDKSGTTEIFTKSLVSFNENWAQEYGYFSKGLDENDQPVHWNGSVIQLYGETNRGLSGLVLTFKYSIAYLSVADAREANIPYASIINSVGHTVTPSTANIHAAMDNKAGDFDHRYIEWFSTSQAAKVVCAEKNMVPLSPTVANRIQTTILDQMFCNGKSVRTLVNAQKYSEYISTQTWRIPVYILCPILIAIFAGLCGYLVYIQLKMSRAIRKKEYLITTEQIKIFSSLLFRSKITQSGLLNNSLVQLPESAYVKSEKSHISMSGDRKGYISSIKYAIYDGKEVCLRKIGLKSPDVLKTSTKHKLLQFRDKTHHLNVLNFFGITEIDRQCYLVSGSCNKGLLVDVLQNDVFNLDVNFKYSISCDIASGMEYLHDLDFIHANLDSSTCYIDYRWTVKIADWEYQPISNSQRENPSSLLHMKCVEDKSENKNISKRDYWTDPDVLLSTNPDLTPTKAGDVYSFAIILVEIFTREDPYDEVSLIWEPQDILLKVKTENLRPQLPKEISPRLCNLICQCWTMPPPRRLSFHQIGSQLNRIKPSKKSVLDCMMAAVENYAVHLEDKVVERTHELAAAMKKTEELLHQMLPPSVAKKLSQGETVVPESVDSVTVFFSDIVGFTAIASQSSPLEIVKFLNDLYTTLDNVIDKHQVYKVETIGDAYMVISGLPQRNSRHAACIADMAIDIADATYQLKVQHMPSEKLRLRAGMHSGPVAAGVVGLKMPRYCLFGDTVNTSSRMESTSVPNKIQCSYTTCQLLGSSYILHPRGEIQVKGKGTMKTYWLHGKRGSDTQMPEDFLRTDIDIDLNMCKTGGNVQNY